MSAFRVDTVELANAASLLESCDEALGAFQRQLASGDQWEGAMSSGGYDEALRSLRLASQSYALVASQVRLAASDVRAIARTYRGADDGIVRATAARLAPHGPAAGGGGSGGSATSPGERAADTVEGGLTFAGAVTDGTDKEGIDSIKGFVSYAQALIKYFGNDEGPQASDFLKLCKESGDLWKDLYDWAVKGLGDPKDATGIFSEANQDRIAGLGVISSMFGFGSSWEEVRDGIASGSYGSFGEAMNDLLTKVGGSGVDLAKSAVGALGTDGLSTGVYNPGMLWATFGKTVLSTAGQTFESIGHYSADGSWSATDTGATMIETSVAGLYTLADGLSLGILGKVTGAEAGDISSKVEGWATDFGTWLGEKSVEQGWSWVFGG